MKRTSSILAALLLASSPTLHAVDFLNERFQHPPASARPQTWWHWVSGNVSKEGITADLEAMKKIGLAGVQIFTVDQSAVKGPVKFMSPEWWELMHYALDEAKRLKLEISIEGCDGWCESGGPWVTPGVTPAPTDSWPTASASRATKASWMPAWT